MVGITFAVFTRTLTSNDNTVNTGRISMSYTEPSNALILENALPMTDEEGKAQTKYFEFTVATHATTNANDDTGITIPYEINISNLTIDGGYQQLTKSFVKVNLVKVDGTTETEVAAPTLLSNMSTSTLREGATRVYKTSDTHKNGSATKTTTYRLRAWIDKSFDASTETTYQYKFSVNVNSQVNAVGVEYPEEPTLLRTAILGDNNSNVTTSGNGLYVSTETNDGRPTYYYKAVETTYDNPLDFYVALAVESETIWHSSCNIKEEYSDKTFFNDSYYSPAPAGEYDCQDAVWCGGHGIVPTSECQGYYGITDYVSDVTEYVEWTEENQKPVPFLWRVVRINEDGTIRIAASSKTFQSSFNPNNDELKYMYFSESNVDGGIMKTLNNWYNTNLVSYDSKIATSTYCEALNNWSFKCEEDENGYGLVTNQKIGLLASNEAQYLYERNQQSGLSTWTMTPAGFIDYSTTNYGTTVATVNYFADTNTELYSVTSRLDTIPVINLKADVTVKGSGTIGDPWVVQ